MVLTGVFIAARAPKAPVAEGEQAAPPS
jgi:hypothetical protein